MRKTLHGLVAGALAAPLALLLAGPAGAGSYASSAQVEQLVGQAVKIHSVPSGLTPSLQGAENDAAYEPACMPAYSQVQDGTCVFGDQSGSRTMVLVGDSHAGMWFGAVNAIAMAQRWRLVFLEKSGCPIPDISFWNADTNVAYPQCDAWHSYVIARIKKLDPNLLIVTSADYQPRNGQDQPITNAEWTAGMEKTIRLASASRTKAVIIGDIPYLSEDAADCLAAHMQSVQACSTPRSTAVLSSADAANEAAANETHATYVNVVPWMCSSVCTPIIGKMLVYENQYHITQTYSEYLTGALQSAMSNAMTTG